MPGSIFVSFRKHVKMELFRTTFNITSYEFDLGRLPFKMFLFTCFELRFFSLVAITEILFGILVLYYFFYYGYLLICRVLILCVVTLIKFVILL